MNSLDNRGQQPPTVIPRGCAGGVCQKNACMCNTKTSHFGYFQFDHTYSYSYSYSVWHGSAVQPAREPEAHGVTETKPSLAKIRSRSSKTSYSSPLDAAARETSYKKLHRASDTSVHNYSAVYVQYTSIHHDNDDMYMTFATHVFNTCTHSLCRHRRLWQSMTHRSKHPPMDNMWAKLRPPTRQLAEQMRTASSCC